MSNVVNADQEHGFTKVQRNPQKHGTEGQVNGMIKIDLSDWEERDIKDRIVERISEQIIKKEFKLYGNIPDEGCYTPYDKFKNYVANLVADRIFKYMVDNPEIEKRIDKTIDNAEKTIVATVIKNRKAGEQNE